MQTAISIVIWVVCAVGVFFVAFMLVVDMAGKFDYLQIHFPWLIKWAERREFQGLLLLICLGLLIGDGYELVTKEVPEAHAPPLVIKTAQPPAITVTKVLSPTQKESPNSLRRRTVKLVNDLILFWGQRHAPPAPNPNAADDQDRQRVAKWEQYWRETSAAYVSAGLRERILRIVREYKAKGIPTGYLEAAEQPERLMGSDVFGGIGSLEQCSRFMSDVCYLRELAYHVDAQNEPIFIQP
jgi:hypothetical protein